MTVTSLGELDFLWEGRVAGQGPLVLDFETKGGDATAPDTQVVGLALTDERGTVAIDFRETPEAYEYIIRGIYEARIPVLAHNAMFDSQWPYRDFIVDDTTGAWLGRRPAGDTDYSRRGCFLLWGCTYALYKYLANEDWIGQRHGLKDAQKDLLGWEETNDVELSKWLVENGYIATTKTQPTEGYIEFINKKGEKRWGSPDKGEMWRAPKDILMYYCALDTESTWLLYTHILKPALNKFPVLQWYAGSLFQRFLKILLRSKFRGIQLDVEYVDAYEAFLREEVARTFREFVSIPEVGRFREELTEAAVAEVLTKEPPRHRKADIPKEPKCPRLKKDGTVNPQWLRYEERCRAGVPDSPSWLAWRERLAATKAEEHFNPNSGDQMREVIYKRMGKPVGLLTDSGLPSVGKKALRSMPEMQVLIEYIGYKKELSTIESLRGVSHKRGDNLVYPISFRLPRTSTGRLGGSGGFNGQNIKKSPIMHGFPARPGYTLWSFDVASLEQVVLAELSRDPVLWEFYGPHVPKGNCIYLYEGSQYPVLGRYIRESGYDPFNWTADTVKKAKDWLKKQPINWRDVAKVFVLSGSYGAGGAKNHETLTLAGINDVSLDQCNEIIKGRRELYSGVKRWNDELVKQWKNNGGWVLNGIGRPQAVCEDFLKDIVNRVCQGTGHDLLMMLVVKLAEEVEAAGLDAHPWIPDVHDATYFEVAEHQGEMLTELFNTKVLPWLNRYIRATIPLTGEPMLIRTLGEDKEQPRFWEIKVKRGEELTPLEQALADMLEELEEEQEGVA